MKKLVCKVEVQDGKTGQWYKPNKIYNFDEERAQEVLKVKTRQGNFYFEEVKKQVDDGHEEDKDNALDNYNQNNKKEKRIK